MDEPDCISDNWTPPTPRSQLVPLPPPALPVEHLVLGLLPPPLLPHETPAPAPASEPPGHPNPLSLQSLLSKSSEPTSSDWPHPSGVRYQESLEPADKVPHACGDERISTRPRRSAAVVAARKIPRQPSPFDLDDAGEVGEGDLYDEQDADGDSVLDEDKGSGGSAGGGKKPSKRKVSHSVIERRRREKINACLETLRETVPQLREEGQRKLEQKRVRGRKRGRGGGEHGGGLHKLEILQGTIQYIDELRSRIANLEATSSTRSAAATHTLALHSLASLPSDASLSASPPPFQALSSPILRASVSSALKLHIPGLGEDLGESVELEEADHEAGMLLLDFATSPELRPVM
ncbi:hypothetical protein JCM11641_007741 [Rhodosporidiobolus odoratus]